MNAFVASFLISATALISFWPSLDGDFVFDDVEAIVNNADIQMTSPWYQTFHNDFWGKLLVSNTSHKSYRPLTVLTFRLNSMWTANGTSESLRPFGFHAVNLGLHVVGCLVTLCAYSLVTGRRGRHVPDVAFHAALLFAAHPIHSENVAGIVGRADILCAVFFFLTFLTYTRTFSTSNDGRDVSSGTRSLLMTVCALSTAVSMLFKEQGVTVLGICFVYDVLVTFGSKQTTKLFPFLRRCSFLVGIGCFVLSFRWWIMGSSPPIFQRMDNPSSFLETRLQRALNYNYVYSINAWILIHPLWLCYDWSMGCIPSIETATTDWRVFPIVVFWTIVSALVVVAIGDLKSRSKTNVAISISLIIVPFIPASNLLFRVGFVVAERILFIPSSGFCLLVAIGYERILDSFSRYNWIIRVLGASCLLVFILRSRQRSYDWLSEESLFESGLKICPLNAKVHYNIAKKAADAGRYEAAVEQYAEALRLFPQYDQAMNNLANILKDEGRLLEAEDLLVTAVRIRPDFAAAWMNLGIVQSSLGKYDAAEISYWTALSHRQQYPDCYYNLGNLYLEKKQYEDALRAWLNATSLKPTHSVSWNNMIIMLDNRGDFDRARSMAEEAIQLLPHESSIHFNMANVLGKIGEFERSEDHFLTAIRISPENSSYFTNLGVLYHRWKRYSKAEEAYRRAIKLNPSMQSARDNLSQLLDMKAKLGSRTASSASI